MNLIRCEDAGDSYVKMHVIFIWRCMRYTCEVGDIHVKLAIYMWRCMRYTCEDACDIQYMWYSCLVAKASPWCVNCCFAVLVVWSGHSLPEEPASRGLDPGSTAAPCLPNRHSAPRTPLSSPGAPTRPGAMLHSLHVFHPHASQASQIRRTTTKLRIWMWIVSPVTLNVSE